jgi:predicted helicase
MTSFNQFISSFDKDSSKRGKQFEVFVKWFLQNDPVWKSEVDKVWMWDDYPDRWGKDCGIDLVFKDKVGETWAVQAKCYSREYDVTKKDIDSFLSESSRPLIHRRLLIATTDNLGPNARKVCAEQEKPVTLFLFSDFEDSAIEYPESISDLSRAKLKPKPQPTGKYSYQLEPINAVVDKFKAHEKGQLIMACGTGKTFTTLWIKEKLNAETTLILLPSLSLLSQTLKEWTFAMNQPFKSLCICSDDTVSKGASEDQLLESVQDLSFPVTADPNLIRNFLNSPGTKVIFSTYQSSPMIAEAQKLKDVPAFDLVIADEAHRCAGKVSSSFTTVLNDDLIRSKKKLFTTATPRTYSASLKKQGEELDFEISGMDDEKVFGTEFYRLSFGNAIERGLLSDYQLVIIGVDEPMIADWIKRRELLQTNDEIVDAKSLAAEIGLIKAIKDYNLKRVLSFHSRVKSAEDFSKELPKVLDLIDEPHKPKGKLATGFVSGKMPTNQRRLKLDQLKELTQGDYAVLSNARCLSEGVDVPALDGIAIIDPKASQIDIVQTVGRAIRLSENKSVGTIIIPVFIQNGDDPEASIESTNFKPLWDVIKALKSHDEILAFELDTLRTEMGKHGKRSVQVGGLKKIVIDVPQSVNNNFSNSLRTHLIEYTTASWNFWYGQLKKIFEETGDANLPQKYPENQTLSNWCDSQRQFFKNQNLDIKRVKLLDEINFIWNKEEASWFKNFDEIKKMHNSGLNINIPKTKNPSALANWLTSQRKNKRRGILSEEKIRLLDDLGLIWDKNDYLWDMNYKILRDVHLNGLKLDHKDKLTLQQWVQSKRQNYKKGLLSEEQRKLLEEINIIMNPYDDIWATNFNKLKKMKESGFNINLFPKTGEYKHLVSWCGSQRQNFKKNLLDEKRIQQLNDLGFQWDPLEANWQNYFTTLKELNSKGIDVNLARNPKEYPQLADWLADQRKFYNKGKLSSQRIQLLESIGFLWNPLDQIWNTRFNALKSIKEKTGDANISSTYKPDRQLGSWLNLQKQLQKRGVLALERFNLLSDIGIKWLDS